MKNSWQWILVAGFLCVLFFWAGSKENKQINSTVEEKKINDIQYIKIAGLELKVELAVTPLQKQQGLSGRNALSEKEGMLFVFDKPDKYSFWMKDMNFPIDIIWISPSGEVVHIKKDARPESYPATFVNIEDALYVLEVASGFSDKNNLKEGDRVLFLY